MHQHKGKLQEWVNGCAIGVSGPHKCDKLLNLAIMHNALIAINSLNELNELKVSAPSTNTYLSNSPIVNLFLFRFPRYHQRGTQLQFPY